MAAMARILILLALLPACSQFVELEKYQDIRYPCPYLAEDIGLLAAVTEQEFSRIDGRSAAGLTDDVRVQCVPGLWQTSGGLASGQTYDERTVRISYTGGDIEGVWPLRYTALSHELIHVMLWRLDGDGDAAHESEAWDAERKVRIRMFGDDNGCRLDPLG